MTSLISTGTWVPRSVVNHPEKKNNKPSLTETDSYKNKSNTHYVFDNEPLSSKKLFKKNNKLFKKNNKLSKNNNKLSKETNKLSSLNLPIHSYLTTIVNSINVSSEFIVSGETGSGKTVSVPIKLSEIYGKSRQIVTSVPTRLSTGIHSFVSTLTNNKVGWASGGQVEYNSNTDIVYATYQHVFNSLLRQHYGCENTTIKIKNTINYNKSILIIDEIHTRNSIELCVLILLAQYLLSLNMISKIVYMSATVPQDPYYITLDRVNVPGKVYPVDIFWNDNDYFPYGDDILFATKRKIKEILTPNTTVLIFVPGSDIIDKLYIYIYMNYGVGENIPTPEGDNNSHSEDLEIYVGHSTTPNDELQNLMKPRSSKYKVILSTNVAESSVTIPDVDIVIDMGLHKTNKVIGKKTVLTTCEAPQSSIIQRKGRAGRTHEGKYYPIFTEFNFKNRPYTDELEIDKVDPISHILQLLEYKLDPKLILKMNDERYDCILYKLYSLDLVTIPYPIDSIYYIRSLFGEQIDYHPIPTEMSKYVLSYPCSLENAILLYKVKEKGDPILLYIAIISVSFIEGLQGGSLFWYPRNVIIDKRKDEHFEQHFSQYQKERTDYCISYDIIEQMLIERENTLKRGKKFNTTRWAKEQSFNTKLFNNVITMMNRLGTHLTTSQIGIDCVAPEDGSKFDILQYGSTLIDGKYDEQFITLYNILKTIYSDRYHSPKQYKQHITYIGNNEKYSLDSHRSIKRYNLTETFKIIGAVQVNHIASKYGVINFISWVFPIVV